MYKHKDIKVVLETMLSDKTTDLIAYKQVIADFCNKVPNKNVLRCVFQCEEFEAICEKFNIENAQDYPYVEEDIENMLKMFYDLFELPLHDNEKENLIMTFVKNFAFCSDDEECCENKIYIVVKNLANEDSDFVQEYDSWDEATKEVDEWYTSCCDDLYLAENMMYPILCSVLEHEWDYCMNFCTVIEFNATYFEDGREAWEAENCEFDDCDDYSDDED